MKMIDLSTFTGTNDQFEQLPGKFMVEQCKNLAIEIEKEIHDKSMYASADVISALNVVGVIDYRVSPSEDTFCGFFKLFNKKNKVYIDVDSKGIVFK